MTMLDRMRRHKAWLKWSLAIVVAAFILLYVPSFLRPTGVGAAPSDVLVTVDDRPVTVRDYTMAYQTQVMNLQSMYGAALDEQVLQQLGIAQNVLDQLVNNQSVLAEADRIGLRVSDAEVAERIHRMPGFQENGQFVGPSRYRQILQLQRPPMQPSEFEQIIRESLLAEKLQAAVTGWMVISDDDVAEEYRRRNEKVQLELAVLTADQFRASIDPSEADLTAHFDANTDSYRLPEKRRVRYLAVEPDRYRTTVEVTPEDVQARYAENSAMYSTPEQTRARHILFRVDAETDEAAARAEAETVLTRVRAGEDFATLAREFSDDTSAAEGGDLGYFGRGAMVPEFDDVAWTLAPGETSDLVRTSFGFHIIKVEDRRPASTRSLDEVRTQLEEQIRTEKAQAEAMRIAQAMAGEIEAPEDLDRVAAEHGLTVEDSGLFAQDEPLAGLGFAPAVASAAFLMEQGAVSDLLRTPNAFVYVALEEIAPSRLPTLDEVRDQVREDVVQVQAMEQARTRAEALSTQTSASGFATAAGRAGVEVVTTDMVTRGTSYPGVGISPALDEAVFDLETGAVSTPVSTGDAIVVARVTDREDVDQDAFESDRDLLRDELTETRRGTFFSAYMQKAVDGMEIAYNTAAIEAVLP